MAGREVGEAVGAADGLDVVHVALAAKVAGGRQVDLEGLRAVAEKKMKVLVRCLFMKKRLNVLCYLCMTSVFLY